MTLYDATKRTITTPDMAEAAVGARATLALTGKLVGFRISDAGPYMLFEPDTRWGMPDFQLGLDLEAFDLHCACHIEAGDSPCPVHDVDGES